MRFGEHARRKSKRNERSSSQTRLVDFETIGTWEWFDSDLAEDLAAEIREYFIPDFSNWKDHDSF